MTLGGYAWLGGASRGGEGMEMKSKGQGARRWMIEYEERSENGEGEGGFK